MELTFKKTIMKNILKLIFSFLISSAFLCACNLDEEISDSVPAGDLSANEGVANLEPILGQLANSYQSQNGLAALQLVTSDEVMVPSQGADWSDGGVWRQLQTHTWDAAHPDVLRTWNDLHISLTRANDAIVGYGNENNAIGVAQARFYRAYTLWLLADVFGSVPYRDENNTDFITPPEVLSRSEAIALAITELESVLDDLPGHEDNVYPYPTQDAAQALLAKIYLNKFIYDGLSTAPSDDMEKVITYANDVINSGNFSLSPANTYFTDNFGLDNGTVSTEIILAIQNGEETGRNMDARIRPYTCWDQGGWNGFAVLADFYNSFDQDDIRFHSPGTAQMTSKNLFNFGFLAGQQLSADSSNLTTQAGAPLDLTVEAPLYGALQNEGPRVIKFEPDEGPAATGTDNPLLRYSDVVLMKAEAEWRSGQGDAIATINELRANRGVPNLVTLSADGQEILDERGYELYLEMHRRTDLIRFDKFSEAWSNKEITSPSATLFPIPATALGGNPNLIQNPGY